MLTDPDAVMTPHTVRALMSLVLMSCYDRKVKREFMAEMIDATAEINILLARMEGGAKLRAAFITLKPDMKTDKIDEEIDQLCRDWAKKKAIVANKFNLVMECATSEDTVH